MTRGSVLLLVSALIGIVAPFLVARHVLDSLYVPAIRGSAPPLGPQIGAYSIALVISLFVFFVAARIFRKINQPGPTVLAVPEDDELPY